MRKLQLVLMVVLVSLCVIKTSEAWVDIAVAIGAALVKKWVCNKACNRVCDKRHVCQYVCRTYGCRWVFSGRRDESQIEYDAIEGAFSQDPAKKISAARQRAFPRVKTSRLRLPTKFSEYDVNRDGKISPVEFLDVLHMVDTSVRPIFEAMDRNKDGFISCKEFKKVPGSPLFKTPPTC